MRKGIIFFLLMMAADLVIGALLVALTYAPEPWEHVRWEENTSLALGVMAWPALLAMLVAGALGWQLPFVFILFLFLASGAFWAAAIQVLGSLLRRKKSRKSCCNTV